MTNFFDRPQNEKKSPRPKPGRKVTQSNAPHLRTVPHTCIKELPVSTSPLAKPHRNEVQGILPDKRRVPHGWPACLRRQPPRVAFQNNDIYVIDDEEYEEPRERQPKVQYKLKLC